MTLTSERCVACRRDSPLVTDKEIVELSQEIPDWHIVEMGGVKRLERTFRFKTFQEALDFTMKVGSAAEEEGHHPSITTEWGSAAVVWWTHAIGGLHRNDFIMSAKTDLIFRDSHR